MQLSTKARIASVTLRVADLERSTKFYRDVLGLRLVDISGTPGTGDLAFAAGDDVLVRLIEASEAAPQPARALGLYHFALLVPDRPALAQILRRLGERNWRLTGASDHHVSEALYLADPDGHGIEIYRDRPRERWTVQPNGELYMTTRALDLDDVLRSAPGTSGLPEATTIGHIHLHVSDLQQSRRFYADRLGFEVTVSSYPGALFLSVGGYHHHLGLNTWAGLGATTSDDDVIGMARFEIGDPSVQDEVQLDDPDGIRLTISKR